MVEEENLFVYVLIFIATMAIIAGVVVACSRCCRRCDSSSEGAPPNTSSSSHRGVSTVSRAVSSGHQSLRLDLGGQDEPPQYLDALGTPPPSYPAEGFGFAVNDHVKMMPGTQGRLVPSIAPSTAPPTA